MTVGFLSLLLNPFARQRSMTQFFRLRKDIVSEMLWTIVRLEPLILPYFPSEQLPGMGYITASLHTKFFVILVKRKILSNGFYYIISITSTCYPNEHFPFGIAVRAVSELEGIGDLARCKYDTLGNLDDSLQTGLNGLQKHLSCENFDATKLIMTRLLNEAMEQGTQRAVGYRP